MRNIVIAATIALSFAGAANAKVCRDSHHHKVHCPPAHASRHCRDAHGHDMPCHR